MTLPLVAFFVFYKSKLSAAGQNVVVTILVHGEGGTQMDLLYVPYAKTKCFQVVTAKNIEVLQ